MGIFTKVKSTSDNNMYLKSPKTTEKSKKIELNMSRKEGSADEREEGEIIDEFEDIISSDEEFSMRKRIEELEAKNAELEKIANISVSAVYASGGYNDYPKKDSHHLDRYPLVSINISDDEEYPPAPKMPRISKRRKSMLHSSSRHKLLHTSSSSHRRRKRSSSPPPAPQYRQSDKLLLSLFHERVVANNSHSSKRKRKNKKTHSAKASRRKSREHYVSDTDDDHNNFESYNVDNDDNHEHFNSSDCDKNYSLNRDELRVALARNTHRIEQHASLKDRLTRKKENTDMFNFVPSVEESPTKETLVVEEEEQVEKPSSAVEDKAESDDNNLEEQELRILALKSAVLKKHMVRKKRNENVAYSPSDFDEIYKCISESTSLNNIDDQETCNSMEISPVPSPKMILSDDGGIDTKPVDMDIVNSDSECELPSYDRWIPIEQIPLPNSIGINEELYNPTPIRYNNNEERHVIPPEVRYETASVSPKNFDSEVDEEELALRALLLAKMNSPKVNKTVKKEPPKVVQVKTPDPDVSLEAETLRNFLISNMKKKAKPKDSSASVLKEAVRRLTCKNASPSPTEASIESIYPVKTADETEKDLTQAISDMAKVNIGFEESISEIGKHISTSGGIRVRNIDTLRAPIKFAENLDVKGLNSVYPKISIDYEKGNSKENPVVSVHQQNYTKKDNAAEKSLPIKKVIKKETLPGMQITSNNVLKSVSSQKNKTTNVSKTFGRNLTVRIEKMILPKNPHTQNDTLKPSSGEETAIENGSKKMNCIETVEIKAEIISGNLPPSQRLISDVIESNRVEINVVDVDPNICVKIEQKMDQVNQSISNKSRLGKELATKMPGNQRKVHPTDVGAKSGVNQLSETILLNQVDVDPKQIEDVPKVLVENKNQETSPGVGETMNVVVEDADLKKTQVTQLKQEHEHCSVVETRQQSTDINPNVAVESESGSSNLKEALKSTSDEIVSTKNALTTVDPKDVEENVLESSSNTSPTSEEVILESLSEEDVNREKVSKASPDTLLLSVDPIGMIAAVDSQVMLSREVSDQNTTQSDKNKSSALISDIEQQMNLASVIKDKTVINNSYEESNQITMLAIPESLTDVNSNTAIKSEVALIPHEREDSLAPAEKPTAFASTSKSVESTKSVLSAKTRQVKLGTKSIEVQIQQKKTVDVKNHVPPITHKESELRNTQKATEKPQAIVEKLSTPKKILPSTSNVVTPKPIAKIQLPNQQPIATRTKIVKPNKIINQQTIDLKRKTIDNLPQHPVSTKKPRIDDTNTNRLITTIEIPKVPELVIQLRVSESESEYSELSVHDMDEDEDSRVRNFFNRSITIGNEYYDIASPISLPMESPCDTPTRSGSPIISRTQTPQPSVEKSIVNDYFEAKLEQFLKNVRSKVSDNISKPIEGKKIAAVNSTPVAVRHLPEASQQEYRRLINRMKMLERQKQAKNVQVHVKPSDAGTSDLRSTITDGDSKFLVRKVLMKNATTKPSASVIQNPKSPIKTDKMIEKPCNTPKSEKSPQKSTSPVSQDGNVVKSSKENLLVLYENSYRKIGTSIICNLDKSIEMVMVAKKAKMAKLKHEQRLRELRKEMEDVQKNLKEQQEKITKIYPDICSSHREIESLKTRRLKINKAVTALGKNVIGPDYSMQNDQKSIISEKSKKLAAQIKLVNTMKLSDVELMEDQNRLNLPDNAKKIIAPVQNLKSSIDEKLPTKSSSVVDPPENPKPSLEIQTPANSLLDEQLPAHKNDMPPMPAPPPPSSSSSSSSSAAAIIKNEVPTCDSQSSEILNKPVPEDMEKHVNNTIVPEIFSNNDDEKACSTTNGHEEALELEQPVAVGDNNNNNEQAPEQTNMDENNEEEENGGEQVGSAKLQDYVSPLSHLRDERHINPNGVVCPYQLMGQCDDKDCKYMHLEY